MRVLHVIPCANPELARTLLKIQHAAYALEAPLIDDDRIPALHEDVEDLGSAPLLWLAAFIDGRLVGALAWSENDEELDITAWSWRRTCTGVARGLHSSVRSYSVPESGAPQYRPAVTTPRPRPCTSSWDSRGPKMKGSSRDCG